MRQVYLALLTLCVACRADANEPLTHPAEQWILLPKTDTSEPIRFQKRFHLSEIPREARLTVRCDFCDVEATLNRQTFLFVEAYSPPSVVDVADHMVAGDNLLTLRAAEINGPSAVAVRIELQTGKGGKTIVSDDGWMQQAGDRGLQPVALKGAVERARRDHQASRSAVTDVDDYTQWKQALSAERGTDPSSFSILDGFEIELLRSAEKDEGSWIALAFDPTGRLIVAREDKGLLRFRFSADGSGRIERVETVNDALKECRGLVFVGNDLYVNANESRGMYRLRDTTGDASFDRVDLLRRFPGTSGHGRNNLTQGPDGRIYSIHGDAVEIPRQVDDLTSPLREHRQGAKTREGHLVRVDLSGKNWQLVAAGLRNPFGVSFNADGEAFTYDADAEHDMGSPWYRPTRVVHLVVGADYGWRGVTGSWPPYYPDHPDNAPHAVHIGKGSPTSVCFGTNSNFPTPFRDALFILDWAYGRILAVHLYPNGASYCGAKEVFVKGRPFNATGLTFGPDGAMYVVTGGRKTQSGLYRIRYTGTPPPTVKRSLQQTDREDYSRSARAIRRRLESGLAEYDPKLFELAWEHLGHRDPMLRYVARTLIEQRPPEEWIDRARIEKRIGARLEAFLALARQPVGVYRREVLQRLTEVDFGRLLPFQRQLHLYTCQLCLQSIDAEDQLRAKIRSLSEGWLKLCDRGSRDRLIPMLISLESPVATVAAMTELQQCVQPKRRLHYLFALRNSVAGWSISSRRTFLQQLNAAHSAQGGAGMPMFLQRIRDEFAATLTPEEAKALRDLLATPDRNTALLTPIDRPKVREWSEPDVDTLLTPGSPPDVARGRRLFGEVLCARCHRLGDVGSPVGPDLTSITRRFDRRAILTSIISPSKVVDEQFKSDKILTADGRVIVGRIVPNTDYRSEKLRILPYPFVGSRETVLAKSEIVSHVKSPVSIMPRGLLDTLTAQQVRDLLAFLESGLPASTPEP